MGQQIFSNFHYSNVGYRQYGVDGDGCWFSVADRQNSKIDLLKQMARTVGASPSEIKEALEALAEPHRIYATPQERENDEIQVLTKVFVDKISDRLKSSSVPESGLIRV